MVLIQNVAQNVSGDPCSLLWGSLKTECESLRSNGGSGSTPGQSTGQSLLSILTNPESLTQGLRHFMTRIAEVIIGGILVIIGLNALIKAQLSVNVIGSTTKAVKKTVKAVK